MTEMSLEDRVAEAIYDSVDQWGSLWDKVDRIKADYRAMARGAIAEVEKARQVQHMSDEERQLLIQTVDHFLLGFEDAAEVATSIDPNFPLDQGRFVIRREQLIALRRKLEGVDKRVVVETLR